MGVPEGGASVAPNHVSDVQNIFCKVTINQKFKILLKFRFSLIRLQCADTVGWASGRASACKKMSNEVLVWLSVLK